MSSLFVVVMSTTVLFSFADIPAVDVLQGNKDAKATECQSWWSPAILQTNTNTTVILGECKLPAPSRAINYYLKQSHDAGATWGELITLSDFGPVMYSKTSGELLMIVDMGTSAEGVATQQAKQQLAAPDVLTAHADPVFPGLAWARDLPQLTPAQLAKCAHGITRSKDDGLTWSKPTLLQVNNSLGPHYGGNGLAHGIQLQHGPHAGRLAMAERLDCVACEINPKPKGVYLRSYVLYSDDDGANWNAGQLLPELWTECQVAEMHNGSVLMSSRIEDFTKTASPIKRGFARSDDGGRTWAEVWYLYDRQPEIEKYEGICEASVVSDITASGTLYWGAPFGASTAQRNNYTVSRSVDNGASWEIVNRVFAGGAGYSDMHVLNNGTGTVLAIAFQKTFDPPVPAIEGGGYSIGLILMPLEGHGVAASTEVLV